MIYDNFGYPAIRAKTHRRKWTENWLKSQIATEKKKLAAAGPAATRIANLSLQLAKYRAEKKAKAKEKARKLREKEKGAITAKWAKFIKSGNVWAASSHGDDLPPKGVAVKAYKGVKIHDTKAGSIVGAAVIELLVPKTASRVKGSCSFNRSIDGEHKCRASEVEVTALVQSNIPFNKDIHKLRSPTNSQTVDYVIGRTTNANYYERNNIVCAGGIHFFLTHEKAAKWVKLS